MTPAHIRLLIDAVIRAAAAKAARQAGFWEILVREGEDEAIAAWGRGAREQAALDAAMRELDAAIHAAIQGATR